VERRHRRQARRIAVVGNAVREAIADRRLDGLRAHSDIIVRLST